MLASGPVQQGFESTWSRVLPFFSFASFLPYTKTHTFFFRFSDLMICGFLVRSDSVRTAAAVVTMYRFTAVPHVLYSSTNIHNVLFTAVGRQMSGFEPCLPCFCAFSALFFVLFLGGCVS